MILKTKSHYGFKGIVSFLLMVGCLACQGRFYGYQGAVVGREYRILLLEGGPHQGSWRTNDLTIYYGYSKKLLRVELSGRVELAGYLQKSFSQIENFFLTLHFLDSAGTVLKSSVLLTAGYRQEIEKLSFNRLIEVVPETAAIVFSYKGRVREGSGTDSLRDGDAITWDFWKAPFD
ncbi:MAG: hypothetical protein JW786_10590 [Desulfobacterales bacterium]|nr:hypothetical protein [Desulfobacterales bacterium]